MWFFLPLNSLRLDGVMTWVETTCFSPQFFFFIRVVFSETHSNREGTVPNPELQSLEDRLDV